MFFESDFKTGLKDIGKNNLIKNEAILEILEDIAGEHSNVAGYGALDINRTHLSWVLLDWKVKVLNRPMYMDSLKVKTWGRNFQKAYTYRDYEVYNSKGELAIIATSKWVMMNTEKRNIVRLSDEIASCYQPENDKNVFGVDELEKTFVPDKFLNEISYTVGRKDIDINGHMHNTYYLNLAYEAFPQDVYENRPYDEFRITYKKEIAFGDTVKAKYTRMNGKHVVVIYNEKKNVINAILEFE